MKAPDKPYELPDLGPGEYYESPLLAWVIVDAYNKGKVPWKEVEHHLRKGVLYTTGIHRRDTEKMTVWLKQGVCGDPKREIRRAIGIVHSWAIARDEDVYIHSLRDGVHIAGSLHYDGYAFDFSHRHRLGLLAPTDYVELSGKLGPGYDLVIEEDHIHIEWDPK